MPLIVAMDAAPHSDDNASSTHVNSSVATECKNGYPLSTTDEYLQKNGNAELKCSVKSSKDVTAIKETAWSFGNFRKPFLEHLKWTPSKCSRAWVCWKKRRPPTRRPPPTSTVGMHTINRLSKGDLVSTDLDELNMMLDENKQRRKSTQLGWRGYAVLAVCILSVVGSYVMWTTDAFDTFVARQVILDNSSSTFSWWVDPPVKPWLHVRVFNYTNLDEYIRNPSIKLKLDEIGPFVYQELITRDEIVFNEDNTISYRELKKYEFMPNMSKANSDAEVIVPNMPYLGAVSQMTQFPALALPLSLLLKGVASEPFIRIKPKDLIWGYQDTLFSMSKFNIMSETVPFERVGLLVSRLNPEHITIQSGVNNLDEMSYFTRYNGKTKLSAWPDPTCNSISGTDGSTYPPLKVRRKQPLTIFKAEACRLVPFEFNKTSTAQGIPTYRYVIPEGVFHSPRTFPENLCYCNKTNLRECPIDGLFDVAPCSYGAPFLISFPHFLRSNPILLEPFEGLNPDPEIHDMWADIHPRLGMALQGRSRLQVNMQVRRHWSHSHYNMFPDKFVLPIAWCEQSLPSYEKNFKLFLQALTYSLDVLEFFLLYIQPLLVVITAFFLCRRLFVGRTTDWRPYSFLTTAAPDSQQKQPA